jgi:hypothetical protein
MSSEGAVAVSAAVVALVQLAKWAGMRDSYGPGAVIVVSMLGVLMWLVSGESWPPGRVDIWPIFTGIINVTLASAGVFGFTRAAASAVSSFAPPPSDGAGSSKTIKTEEETIADDIIKMTPEERAELMVEIERRRTV